MKTKAWWVWKVGMDMRGYGYCDEKTLHMKFTWKIKIFE